MEQHIYECLQAGNAGVLITLVQREGLTPRAPGAQILLTAEGCSGSIGGGPVEAQALDCAQRTLDSGVSTLLHAPWPQSREDSTSPATVDLLVEYLSPDQAPLFDEALTMRELGQLACWTLDITRPQAPQRLLRAAPEEFYAHMAQATSGQPAALLLGKKPGLYNVAARKIYLEPITSPQVLLLCGGGHVALAVAALAEQAHFVVDVVDDRPDYANPERFPLARRHFVLPDYAHLAEICGIGADHYIAIFTRDPDLDRAVLSQALGTKARYIGMVGQRKKRDALYALLREQGFPTTELACVRCPIGLPVGAESPEELAIAVMAELIAARAGCLPRAKASL